IDRFIASNSAYISDQAEVITGYATLTRAGLNVNEVQLDMNRALDLAALKHISLSEAVALVNNAEHGRLRGLIDLGITSKEYVDSSGNVVNANKNMALVMAELDAKTAHGRQTTTQMSQATNRLSNDWQNVANEVGPSLLQMLDAILKAADFLVQKLKELGANKDWNRAISAGLGTIQNQIIGVVSDFRDLIAAIQWLSSHAAAINAATSSAGHMHAQHGGPVVPGGIYTVGEAGPETLVMGGQGGYVIPNAGTTNNYNLSLSGSAAVNDPEGVRRMLQRMQL